MRRFWSAVAESRRDGDTAFGVDAGVARSRKSGVATRVAGFATAVQMAAMAGCLSGCKPAAEEAVKAPAVEVARNPADDAFLEDLGRRCYRFFEEAIDPTTGMTADRRSTDGNQGWGVSSIAATGFGLSAQAVAASRGWVPAEQAAGRCEKVLAFMLEHAAHEHGFFYQFLEIGTGKRDWESPASSIDNALLLAGALTAAQAFPDSRVPDLADRLYRRMDWQWMLDGDQLLQHGWKPEEGFLKAEWKNYCELMVLVLLAVGAEEHAIPPACWDAWTRGPMLEFNGEKFAHYPPLFIHQYSHAYFDFRGHRDKHLDYWRNSQVATLAQVDYMKRLAAAFPEEMGHYSDDLWGLTASDGPERYMDWGSPYNNPRLRPWRGVDGTLVPSAPGGSLAFQPEECLRTLRAQQEKFGDVIYGRYGFANAHNPRTGWVSKWCIAIDTGITLVMAENLRSGFVWDTFMGHPAATRAFERAGFEPREAGEQTRSTREALRGWAQGSPAAAAMFLDRMNGDEGATEAKSRRDDNSPGAGSRRNGSADQADPDQKQHSPLDKDRRRRYYTTNV